METIDPAKMSRVWQRVKGEPAGESRKDGLLSLIAEEGTDAAAYLKLSREFAGSEGAKLRRLFQEEQAHAACLKGIYTLITGTRPVVRSAQPELTDPEALLRRCYGREMQCLAKYEARASEPEFGVVFARLAEQEREHCRLVLELLGNLKKRG